MNIRGKILKNIDLRPKPKTADQHSEKFSKTGSVSEGAGRDRVGIYLEERVRYI